MKKKRYIILGIIVFIIISGVLIGTIFKTNIEKDLNELSATKISNVDLSTVSDGTYKGKYKVFPVSAVVNVTIEDHKIISIDLLEHKNGQGTDAEILPDKVIAAQTLEVDVVSGATYSSKVILKAIENALIHSKE